MNKESEGKSYIWRHAATNKGTGIIGELQKSQQKVIDILERISDGFLEFNNQLVIMYMNKEAENLLGMSRQKILGRKIGDVLPISDGTVFYREAVRAVEQQIHTYCEAFYPLINKWIEAHYYPSKYGMAVFFRDITQRKEKEVYLRRSKREFRTLVENSRDIIARFDRKMRCLYVNPAVELWTGKPQVQIIGKTWRQQGILKTHFLPWQKRGEEVFATGRDIAFETTLELADKKIYCHVHAVPEFADDGSVESVLAIVRDITERKRIEKEMARLDRLNLVGEMAASIGHEVRNPLTAVRGFLQMMEGKPNLTMYTGYFKLMIEEIDRANSIITEFLALAKNKVIDAKPDDLNRIITTVLPLLQADALRLGSTIETELDEIPDLLLDEKEIRQCILNFVRNALEAMPDGGVVTISTYCQDTKVVLSVTDEGQGIPVYIIDKLGTPFLTTKDTGTGLGLPVCYSIVERHHASISVDTGPEGTTFYVIFDRS